MLLNRTRVLSLTVVFGGTLAGCASNPLAPYEALTARTAADLEAKTQRYVIETAVLDSARQTQQTSLERRLLSTSAVSDTRLATMGIVGDSRQATVAKLQQASDQYLADRLQQPSAATALTELAPPMMTDVVTALDKLSSPVKPDADVKELFAYFKEVYGDIKKDKDSKDAEAAMSAAAAPKKP